jgi:ABC-2 type transport system permease protein
MIATIRRLAATERLRVAMIGVGLSLFMLMIVVVFDQVGVNSFKGPTEDVPSITRGFDIRSFVDPDFMFANLIGVAYAHPLFLAMMGSICIGLGARSCAGELHDGTLELTLARPLSRSAYLVAYAGFINVAALLLLTLVAFVIPAGVWLVGLDVHVETSALVSTTFASWMLYATFGGLSILLSVFTSSRGQALLSGIALLVATYFIEFFARLWTKIEVLGYASPFHYYSPTDNLIGGGTEWRDIAVLAGICAAAYAGAFVRFARRDLA